MKKQLIYILCSTTILFSLAACEIDPMLSYFSREESSEIIELTKYEELMSISLLDDAPNNLKIGSEIWLRIDNLHSESVILSKYSGIVILRLSEDGRVLGAVSNKVIYDPNSPVLIDSLGGDDDWTVVVIKPEIINEGKEVTLYIEILGRVYIDGKLTYQGANGKITLTLTP